MSLFNRKLTKYVIQEPIWSSKSIGIKADRVGEDNLIEIVYKDLRGQKIYPNIYRISGRAAIKYQTQMTRGTKLYVIPINDLEVL